MTPRPADEARRALREARERAAQDPAPAPACRPEPSPAGEPADQSEAPRPADAARQALRRAVSEQRGSGRGAAGPADETDGVDGAGDARAGEDIVAPGGAVVSRAAAIDGGVEGSNASEIAGDAEAAGRQDGSAPEGTGAAGVACGPEDVGAPEAVRGPETAGAPKDTPAAATPEPQASGDPRTSTARATPAGAAPARSSAQAGTEARAADVAREALRAARDEARRARDETEREGARRRRRARQSAVDDRAAAARRAGAEAPGGGVRHVRQSLSDAFRMPSLPDATTDDAWRTTGQGGETFRMTDLLHGPADRSPETPDGEHGLAGPSPETPVGEHAPAVPSPETPDRDGSPGPWSEPSAAPAGTRAPAPGGPNPATHLDAPAPGGPNPATHLDAPAPGGPGPAVRTDTPPPGDLGPTPHPDAPAPGEPVPTPHDAAAPRDPDPTPHPDAPVTPAPAPVATPVPSYALPRHPVPPSSATGDPTPPPPPTRPTPPTTVASHTSRSHRSARSSRSMAAPTRDHELRRTFPPFPPRDGDRFAESWWGNAWVGALEQGALDMKRLERGRGYAAQGHVDAITVTPGLVLAYVQGSRPRPYRVQVRLRTLDDTGWDRFLDAAADRPGHIAALLDKEMPQSLAECGVPLLPGPGDLDPRCSCPDRGHPCKHAAALCYQTARLLDADPFVLLLLRGRGERDLLDALSRLSATRAARVAQDRGPAPLPGMRAAEVLASHVRPPLPTPLAPPAHPEQPPAYPAAPGGPDPFALDQLATDAAARAHALLSTGRDPVGQLTFWQDAVRLAAARPGSGLTAGTRSLYSSLASAAGRTPSELARAVAAWRQGGLEGLAVLEEPWDPPAGRFDRARPLLLAADLPAFRPWRNHLTHPGGHVQLRLGRDGLWYAYESEPGHDDWWPRGTPDLDPVGVLTGLGLPSDH
ncbi:SWIM zinc finger family protein [Streptomyces sp. NPDC057424]|uniref:SWIM zinc finger family protein n=1 Tax=Streptomyces sp. NPDC057424 TaxID=3346127 RepID=UPI00369C99A7